MFDIGFSEVLLIFGLTLVVLGPDKLPQVARTIGRWAGRARAMARQFRDQLEAETDGLKPDIKMPDFKMPDFSATPPPGAVPQPQPQPPPPPAAEPGPTIHPDPPSTPASNGTPHDGRE